MMKPQGTDCVKAVGSKRQEQVCDAQKYPGLHASYNDWEKKYFTLDENSGKSPKLSRGNNKKKKRWSREKFFFFFLLHRCTFFVWEWESDLAILVREHGIPSKHSSLNYIEYVPVLCTHRPSFLTLDCFESSLEGWKIFFFLKSCNQKMI